MINSEGLKHNTQSLQAITNYQGLEKCKKYRLVSDNETYLIKSFISGRWVQLELLEVHVNE